MKRSELLRIVRRAELAATLLRQPAPFLALKQRREIARDMETLAIMARRLCEHVRPTLLPATADPDATEADLLGGAA